MQKLVELIQVTAIAFRLHKHLRQDDCFTYLFKKEK